MSEVLSALTGMEVLFLYREIGCYKKRLRCSPPVVMQGHVSPAHKHNAVWAIFGGSAGSGRALLTASDIALEENRDLVILLYGVEADKAGKLRQQAQSLLLNRNVKVLFSFISGGNDEGLVRQLDNSACSLVVMHRNGSPRSEKLTGMILSELECPVVLVP